MSSGLGYEINSDTDITADLILIQVKEITYDMGRLRLKPNGPLVNY